MVENELKVYYLPVCNSCGELICMVEYELKVCYLSVCNSSGDLICKVEYELARGLSMLPTVLYCECCCDCRQDLLLPHLCAFKRMLPIEVVCS